jgi:hypothetical protein
MGTVSTKHIYYVVVLVVMNASLTSAKEVTMVPHELEHAAWITCVTLAIILLFFFENFILLF